jgi:hypothetical protein
MKSFRFLIFATIVCGSLTLFAGCRNKSNPGNNGSPSGTDTTKVRTGSPSDTSKVKPVSFAGDQLIQRDYYLASIG